MYFSTLYSKSLLNENEPEYEKIDQHLINYVLESHVLMDQYQREWLLGFVIEYRDMTF